MKKENKILLVCLVLLIPAFFLMQFFRQWLDYRSRVQGEKRQLKEEIIEARNKNQQTRLQELEKEAVRLGI